MKRLYLHIRAAKTLRMTLSEDPCLVPQHGQQGQLGQTPGGLPQMCTPSKQKALPG